MLLTYNLSLRDVSYIAPNDSRKSISKTRHNGHQVLLAVNPRLLQCLSALNKRYKISCLSLCPRVTTVNEGFPIARFIGNLN